MRNSEKVCIGFSLFATAVVVLTLNAVALAGDPPPPVPGVCCAPGGVARAA